jgi:nuclear transcription factor Y gamma
MKADPEVKMISAEAPIIFAKACETFITELTMRAWIIAEENKRRTLQRSDIAAALGKSDMFDFLIDIVPREDATPQHKRRPDYAEPQPGTQEQGHVPQPPQQQQQQPQHEFLSAQPEQQAQQAYYPQQPVFDPSMYQQVYTGAPPEQQGQYGSG